MEAKRVESAEHGPLAVETDERAARADWRSSVVGTALVTVFVGLWLAISAALLDYDRPELAVIWGVVIAIIGLARLLGSAASATLACLGIAAGLLTIATALIADETSGPKVNIGLMGAAAVVLSFVALAAARESGRGSRP